MAFPSDIHAKLHVGILAADLTHRHGWAHYATSLIAALHRAGMRLTVLTTVDSPPMSGALSVLPPLDPMPPQLLLRTLCALPRARAALAGCNVIHALAEPYAPLAALIAGKRPLFVTAHGSYVRVHNAWRPPTSWIQAWALRQARLLCVSQYTAQVAKQAMPRVRTTVITNGVDTARFAYLPAIEKDDMLVLCVGAVKVRKGQLQLVRAMARVRQQLPNARALLIGSTSLEPEYVKQVHEEIRLLGLNNAIELAGRVPDETLLQAYAKAVVFVLPSTNVEWKFEGFGLALLEASAAGLPVIGTRDNGAEDAVQDGLTGLLIPQEDKAALANAIIRLLTDKPLAAKMGVAGKAFAATHTWDDTAQGALAAYQGEM